MPLSEEDGVQRNVLEQKIAELQQRKAECKAELDALELRIEQETDTNGQTALENRKTSLRNRLAAIDDLLAGLEAPRRGMQTAIFAPLQQDLTTEIKKAVQSAIRPLTRMVVESLLPKRNLTSSELEHHQKDFESRLFQRYNCAHPSNPDVTKCMLLNKFFSKNDVIAAHLLGLNNVNSLLLVKLSPSDLWSDRNGILIHQSIKRMFDAQNATFLYNEETHAITFQVLFDDMLDECVGDLTKKSIGRTGKKGKRPLRFRDLNGRPLIIPSLTFPFRRCLFLIAFTAYKRAMESSRGHLCAIASCPSEEKWNAIRRAVFECSDETGFCETFSAECFGSA